MRIIIVLLLAVIVLLLIGVARAYWAVPLVELKRRARSGSKLAKSLYKVAGYQFSAQFFLWLVISIASTALFILLFQKSPLWVAATVCLALLWLAFVWFPLSSLNVVSQFIAQALAPYLGWLLEYIDKPISFAHKRLRRTTSKHTGLYEKDDLIRLIDVQQKQHDNRISEPELKTIKQAILFNDQKVIDAMTPARKIVAINVNDVLGPVVLSELHRSRHSYFPVYKDKKTSFVGVLDINGLTIANQNTVRVAEVMQKNITYVHEDQLLADLLRLITTSYDKLFIVINNFEEFTGIITVKDIISMLIGHELIEKFDQYENKEAVAHIFEIPSPNGEETKDEEPKPTEKSVQ